MTQLSRKTWPLSAVVGLVLIAGAIWIIRPHSFDEEGFRDVAHLEVAHLEWEPAPNGYRVKAVLLNRNERSASSVVLTAKVMDESGTLLGTNPLINVLNVPAQAGREFEALIPSKAATGEVKVTIEPAVVSWTE